MSEQSEHRHALLSQAGRIRVYLRTLAARVDELERERGETFTLLMDEKQALCDIMDEVDTLDGKEPTPEPPSTSKPKPIEPGKKTCPGCGETKRRETDYYRNRRSYDGVGTYCKACTSSAQKEARARRRQNAA